MALRTLAPETWDLIIDHLHNDNRALANCSLVCRQWLTSSRYHLFGTLYLSFTGSETKLSKQSRFVNMASDGGICALVRHLQLRLGSSAALLAAYPHFTALKKLTITALNGEIGITDIEVWTFEHLPKLESLDVSLNLTPVDKVLRLIASAKNVKELTLSAMHLSDDGGYQDAIRQYLPPQLHKITVSFNYQLNDSMAKILSWFGHSGSLNDLHMVEFYNITRNILLSAISDMLSLLREHLHHISFHFDQSMLQDEFVQQLSFTANTDLRSITLYGISMVHSIEWLPDLLSTVTSRYPVAIKIKLVVNPFSYDGHFIHISAFAAIDKFLDDSNLKSSFRTATVELIVHFSRNVPPEELGSITNEVIMVIQFTMPLLHAQQRLKISME